MVKNNIIKKYWFIFLLVLLVLLLIYSNNKKTSATDDELYQLYKSDYILPNGAIISNHVPVSWCPSSTGCTGCGTDVTSEAVSRSMRLALTRNDKVTFDKEVSYIRNTMQNKDTGFLQWKLNADGTPGTCGGINSATDADIIAVQSLITADAKWPNNNYKELYLSIMNGLKPGLINGELVPDCMYPNGNAGAACTHIIKLGYIDLNALQSMCGVDSSWCNVYTENKKIVLGAVTDKGVYDTYNADTDTYSFENAPIEPNWVFEHIALNPSTFSYVEPFYTQGKNMFMANRLINKEEICQEFNPLTGCKVSNPPVYVFATYLEIAKARGDTDFASELTKVILSKIPYNGAPPLLAADHYSNVLLLQAITYVTIIDKTPVVNPVTPPEPVAPITNNYNTYNTYNSYNNSYYTQNTTNVNNNTTNQYINPVDEPNTLLYLGIGLVVLIIIIIWRTHKKKRK